MQTIVFDFYKNQVRATLSPRPGLKIYGYGRGTFEAVGDLWETASATEDEDVSFLYDDFKTEWKSGLTDKTEQDDY